MDAPGPPPAEAGPPPAVDLSAAVRIAPASDRPGPFLALGADAFAAVALGEAPTGALEAGTSSGGA